MPRLLAGTSCASFRRVAYNLLGKMCQHAPSLVLPAGVGAGPSSNAMALGGLVPQLLSSEKDPNNFASLLEMVLSYLATFKNDGGGRPWREGAMDYAAFTKALGKALRRTYCGAHTAAWGPTILPIVTSLPASTPGEGREGGAGKEEKERQPLTLVVVSSLVSVVICGVVSRGCFVLTAPAGKIDFTEEV